jgi:excisionase family DNA binding protein
MGKLISTSEAADKLGCTDSWVRRLLREGILRGVRMGRDWFAEERSVKEYKALGVKRGPKPAAEKD